MVISETTTKFLKNFAGISNSVLLVEGKTQKTMTSGKSVLATAQFPEAWPKETGIYALNTLLGTLSLFSAPDIQFDDKELRIVKGGQKVTYRYSDATTIVAPPKDKQLPTANPDVVFSVSADTLAMLKKACAMLELPYISIAVADGTVKFRGLDMKNPTSHKYEYEVPDADAKFTNATFARTMHFQTEHFALLMDGGYKISMATAWKYAYFENADAPIQYFLVQQTDVK